MEATKFCHICNRELPVSAFSKCSSSKDGLQTRCKDCQSAYLKKYKKKNKCNKEKEDGLLKVYSHPDLAKFTPRELIKELVSRGYKGELTFVQRIML